jgi:monofunctional biosynthetic peptidoglycan transglycosylase
VTPDPVRRLLDFDAPGDVAAFAAVDDAVMGGVSHSRLEAGEPGVAVFTGVVSLANNGGFASVRSRPRDWGIGAASAFLLRVRSDGKRYRFNVRTAEGLDAFRYEGPLEPPAGEWTVVEVPVAAMTAKAFGRRVPFAGTPDPARIRTLGLMISDKQAGPFRLEVDWIGWR